jgi:phosphoribosylaminoimidazole-succinocarboxamide synthase
MDNFDALPLFFEGNSRIIRLLADGKLICKLKPTIFSIKEQGYVEVVGIDVIRTLLNAILCDVLHKEGIKTSTVATYDGFIIMDRYEVASVEVVIKSAHVGSAKHRYIGMEGAQTRFKERFFRRHAPYVRFDWRNPLPYDDECMPVALADYFIDTVQATKTVFRAFEILQSYYRKHALDLLDICFFMNREGTVICAEVSTDNCRLDYIGADADILNVFKHGDKKEYAAMVLNLLRGAS